MNSSNCSVTFSGRAGAFPGRLLGERGSIPALRGLYRGTQVRQLGLKRGSASPWCCLVGMALPPTPPGAGCPEPRSTSPRRGWDATSQGAGIRHTGSAPVTTMGLQGVGVPSHPHRPPPPRQVPQLHPFLLSTSSSSCLPANYPVSGVPKTVSGSRHKHFLFQYC